MHRTELLITRNLLHHAAINGFKQSEATDNVQEISAVKQTSQEDFLRVGDDWRIKNRVIRNGRIINT